MYYPDGVLVQDALGGAVTVALNPIGGVLLPAPASADLTPPTASLSLTSAPNASPAVVRIIASDTGSGVGRIFYWVDRGPVTSVAGSTATVSVSGAGAHTVGVRVLDNAGNISQQYTLAVTVGPPGG